MNTDADAHTLDQLCAKLRERLGTDYLITTRESPDGSAHATLSIDGILKATWRKRLANEPKYDGVTPRGPSVYFNLRFY